MRMMIMMGNDRCRFASLIMLTPQLCGATFSSKGDMFLPNPKNDNAHGHYQVSLITIMMIMVMRIRTTQVTVGCYQ